MFSEDWDFNLLNQKAAGVIESLREEGLAQYLSLPNSNIQFPASSNIEHAKHVVIIASGYPEHAGVWSYTLLEKGLQDAEWFKKASMEPYFRKLCSSEVGLIFLNPHLDLRDQPEESMPVYLSQMEELYKYFLSQKENRDLTLLGYSLGADAILRFLHTHPQYVQNTRKLIIIDSSPPHMGRRKLHPDVIDLLDSASFYGMGTEDGLPGEFAEIIKMRLKIKPELFTCQFHGEMPNLVLDRIQQDLQTVLG